MRGLLERPHHAGAIGERTGAGLDRAWRTERRRSLVGRRQHRCPGPIAGTGAQNTRNHRCLHRTGGGHARRAAARGARHGLRRLPGHVHRIQAAKTVPGRTAAATDWRFYLLLVEAVPAETEGSLVARNMVRNMLHGTWDSRCMPSNREQKNWMEARPMRIPEGARAERLRVVGWVQDEQGRVVAAAQSDCGAQPGSRQGHSGKAARG